MWSMYRFLTDTHSVLLYYDTDKNKIKFSSYIRKFRVHGVVAQSYIKKGFLTYEEMRKYFPIYEEAVSHI
jgi:hypothetical protein